MLVLATYGLGSKRDYIAKILGERGEIVLNDLINDKVIEEEQGRIKLSKHAELDPCTKAKMLRIPDFLTFLGQRDLIVKKIICMLFLKV